MIIEGGSALNESMLTGETTAGGEGAAAPTAIGGAINGASAR
jgi:cation transport ATPase